MKAMFIQLALVVGIAVVVGLIYNLATGSTDNHLGLTVPEGRYANALNCPKPLLLLSKNLLPATRTLRQAMHQTIRRRSHQPRNLRKPGAPIQRFRIPGKPLRLEKLPGFSSMRPLRNGRSELFLSMLAGRRNTSRATSPEPSRSVPGRKAAKRRSPVLLRPSRRRLL